MGKSSVTIFDIAKEAKVSVSTVSRVMTGSAPVTAKTKNKVEKVMAKYNYTPNLLARSLSTKHTQTIGVVLPTIDNPFFSSIFLESEKCALEHDYTLFLCNFLSNREVESKYLKILVQKQVDGIIFMGGRLNDSSIDTRDIDELNNIIATIPMVTLNAKIQGIDSYVVRSDTQEGFEKVIRYLAELGHKKIGFIGGVPGVTSHDERVNIFMECSKRYGYEYKDDWIVNTDYSTEDAKRAMKKILAQKELPTAVIGLNDIIAVGAIKAAEENGLRVPDDISVTGFDNINLAELVSPGITTIDQDCRSLGRKAVEVMIDIISGKTPERETVIGTELIIRGSCKSYI